MFSRPKSFACLNIDRQRNRPKRPFPRSLGPSPPPFGALGGRYSARGRLDRQRSPLNLYQTIFRDAEGPSRRSMTLCPGSPRSEPAGFQCAGGEPGRQFRACISNRLCALALILRIVPILVTLSAGLKFPSKNSCVTILRP